MSSMTKSTKTARSYRVDLLRKGYSVRRWALAHGYSPTTVHCAIHRSRRGKRSRSVIAHLDSFLR